MKVLEHRFGYGLIVGILIVCALGAVGSLEFRAVSMWFPFFVGAMGALLAALILVIDIRSDRRARRSPVTEEIDPIERIEFETGMVVMPAELSSAPPRRILLDFARYLAWFAGFALTFLLLGLPLAVFAWLVLFVRFEAKESWLRAFLGAAIMTAFLFVLAATLNLALPEGVLLDSSAIIPSWRF